MGVAIMANMNAFVTVIWDTKLFVNSKHTEAILIDSLNFAENKVPSGFLYTMLFLSLCCTLILYISFAWYIFMLEYAHS